MKKYKYRISEAAVGKIFIKVMEMTRSTEILSEQFHDTIFAALNYIEGEVEPASTAKVKHSAWQHIKDVIDKSAKRSKAARERVTRRRQSLIASSRHNAIELNESSGNKVAAVGMNEVAMQSSVPSRVLSYGDLPYDPHRVCMPAVPPKTPEEIAEHERNMQIARDFDEMCRRIY